MIKNYFKIAWRNIIKNKVFSLINIFGLAVSMSVAILLISIAYDLMMYDAFHAKKEHIYRVISTYNTQDGNTVNLATSSILAAKKIRAEIPLVEDLVILHHGFGGEFQTDKKKVELEGLWAEPSFFDVFSFKLLAGDPKKALTQPNSIVLTERAAKKMFGGIDPMGKSLLFNDNEHKAYLVTGIIQDIPRFSHIQFDALGSFSTLNTANQGNTAQLDWMNIWSDYNYLVLRKDASKENLQRYLTQLGERENQRVKEKKESVSLIAQPLSAIAFGKTLDNQMGPTVSSGMFWFISILSIIVIASACFNYTNLSIGRSLRRSKEVGVRKVLGANKKQLLLQFIVEAVLISFIALFIAVLIFVLIRPHFLSLSPNLNQLLELDLSFQVIMWFIALALFVGIIAGLLPGLFYTKLDIIYVIKNIMPLQKVGLITLKNVLIAFQFTVSLIFITSVGIAYKQYKYFISFDLGFNTFNLLNIKLQGNNPQRVAVELAKIPEITSLSRSFMITSIGNNYYTHIKYNSPDSSAAWYNKIDEQYIPVLGLKLIAGRNFNPLAENAEEGEVIVNETLIRKLNFKSDNPDKAIGEFLEIAGKKLQIVGVVKDFHSNTLDGKIKPFLFRHASAKDVQYINAKILSRNLPETMNKIGNVWKNIDPFHPFEARFYEESIQQAYSEYSSMIKVIGYLSFLTIVISSLGLLGMVIISAESKRKEICIRKIFGASTIGLLYLLSKGFVGLLVISGLFALPVSYIVFDRFVLNDIAYHAAIGPAELFSGFIGVFIVAIILIISQTFKVAATDPAKVLRNE